MPRSQEAAAARRAFRDANAQIEQARARLGLGDAPSPYLCECADVRCTAIVLVEPAVYARVRTGGTMRLVAPGHEEQDAVVEAAASHSVVEERDGRAD